MKKNMGTIDKAVRISIAIIVGVLVYANVITGILSIVLLALSAIFVITSLVSFCPLYTVFGIKTCCGEGCVSGECKKEEETKQ
jgi:hypothetical protein